VGLSGKPRLTLSVVVPVYNEESTITRLLDALEAVGVATQIIVVDDGSTDDTGRLAGEWVATRPSARLIRHPRNRGKGAAVRTALEHVTCDVVTIQDGDLEYDPADLGRMLDVIDRGEADVVYGSRALGGDPYSHLRYYLGGKLLTYVANALYRTRLTDEPTCYKMFRSEIILSMNLVCEGFEFCPEVTARLALRGIKIVEVPIRYHSRTVGQGKKIRWRDGVEAIGLLVKYRLFGPPR